jgi:predicted deacylase
VEDAAELRTETQTERVLGAHSRGRPGPTLICVCGVHGNEPAGAKAAEAVLAELAEADPDRFFGRLVALTGNIAAHHTDRGPCRYIDEDLNRVFTPENVECVRAADDSERSSEEREMIGLLDALESEFATADGPVYVLDLHTFSSRGAPFGAIEDSIATRRFARRFPIPVVLGLEEELRGLFIDHIGRVCGHVAMIFEGGEHHDEQSVIAHAAAIRIALHATGVTPDADVGHDVHTIARDASVLSGRFYDVRHCEPIRDASFEMVDGIESAQEVRRGLVVAHEQGRSCRTPTAGVMFMPNRNADRRPGDDAYFIIRPVHRFSLWLSARLRRQPWIHRLAPRVLPGVRRLEGDADRLLVAPEIAVIFKREIFHLLGYRIERHGVVEHRAGIVRVGLAIGAAAQACAKVVVGLFKGGERAALPNERPDDWVVARRTLDIRDSA